MKHQVPIALLNNIRIYRGFFELSWGLDSTAIKTRLKKGNQARLEHSGEVNTVSFCCSQWLVSLIWRRYKSHVCKWTNICGCVTLILLGFSPVDLKHLMLAAIRGRSTRQIQCGSSVCKSTSMPRHGDVCGSWTNYLVGPQTGDAISHTYLLQPYELLSIQASPVFIIPINK